jgi:hypothetical protein
MTENQIRTLVIHPRDSSTDFLKDVYRNLSSFTLIQGGVTRAEIVEALIDHERIILLGRGSEKGLYASGVFDTISPYIVDEEMFPWLFGKENIFIWRNSDLFAYFNQLQGLFTGKFACTLEKVYFYKIKKGSFEHVEESNNLFSTLLGDLLHLPASAIYPALRECYGRQGMNNPVIDFNCQRLIYYSGTEFSAFKNWLNNNS